MSFRKNFTSIFIIHLLIGGIVVFLPQVVFAEDSWNLRKDKDDITVYTRKVENSKILEYKASVTIDVPLEKVLSIYEDVTKLPSWFHQCVGAQLVEDEGPLQKIIYVVMDLTGPVATRDVVFKQVKSVEVNGEVSYTLEAVPDKFPLQKGKVRMPYLNSIWRFTSLPDGRTEVYFRQHSDPGGSIPAFLINRLVVDIPFHSLKNLRQMALTGKL